jgi:hypothetical protein
VTPMRWRIVAFVAVVVVAGVGAVVYAVHARRSQLDTAAQAPAVSRLDVAQVTNVARIVFRSTALGEDYGKVAEVPVTAPAGPRYLTPVVCDRVYATAKEASCLYGKPGFVTTYQAVVYGADWTAKRTLQLNGAPSRTRMSHDGTMIATTTFVTGHDYATAGQFSTETLITKVDGGQPVNIESFTLLINGSDVLAADRNLWGVTFVDDDHFFATAATGGKTYLVQGAVSTKTLTSVREDAECPSISPDGTRVAFKTRAGLPSGQWHIAVYDLATKKTTLLAEPHSVDDQLEWLDNDHVVYGLPRTGVGASASDVWVAAADGSGASKVLIPDAWSPAVVR